MQTQDRKCIIVQKLDEKFCKFQEHNCINVAREGTDAQHEG